jgi:hypothetical protein
MFLVHFYRRNYDFVLGFSPLVTFFGAIMNGIIKDNIKITQINK